MQWHVVQRSEGEDDARVADYVRPEEENVF